MMKFIENNFTVIMAGAVVIGVSYWLYDEHTKSSAILNSPARNVVNTRVYPGANNT